MRDGHAAEELVELLVVAHREGDVPGDDGLIDARLLVVAQTVLPGRGGLTERRHS